MLQGITPIHTLGQFSLLKPPTAKPTHPQGEHAIQTVTQTHEQPRNLRTVRQEDNTIHCTTMQHQLVRMTHFTRRKSTYWFPGDHTPALQILNPKTFTTCLKVNWRDVSYHLFLTQNMVWYLEVATTDNSVTKFQYDSCLIGNRPYILGFSPRNKMPQPVVCCLTLPALGHHQEPFYPGEHCGGSGGYPEDS